MSSRNKKIIGVLVAILVLLLLIFWLASRSVQEDVVIVNTQPGGPADTGIFNDSFGTGATGSVLDATGPAEPVREPENPDPRSNLKRLAASFAERYGSFSNQGDFENLKELRVFMTDSMVREVDAYIVAAGASGSASPAYVGMTTRALSSTVENLNETAGTAVVVVNTQRQEVTSAGTRVFYQEIRLEFVRSGEIWKIDSAEWLED